MKATHNPTKKPRKPTPLTQEQVNIMIAMLLVAKTFMEKRGITHLCNALKYVMVEIKKQSEAKPEAIKVCRKANKYLLRWIQSMLGGHYTLEGWIQDMYDIKRYETLYAKDDRLTRTRAAWIDWMINELTNQGEVK